MVVVMVMSEEMSLATVDEKTEEAEEKLSLSFGHLCMAIIIKIVRQKAPLATMNGIAFFITIVIIVIILLSIHHQYQYLYYGYHQMHEASLVT